MSSIEITAVERLDSANARLLGWVIDYPQPQVPVDGYFLRVAGWAVGRGCTVDAINVLSDERVLTSIPSDPGEWLRRVAEYAGVDSTSAAVDRMLAAGNAVSHHTRAHRTSADSPQSIGRYRRDMDADIHELCIRLGGELLTSAGYSI